MVIHIDHSCSFERQGGFYIRRYILFGEFEWTPVTYDFQCRYASTVRKKEFPRKVFKWMQNTQIHTPVFIAARNTRSYWWFQDVFYHTNEDTDDPEVFKGLLLQQQLRAQNKAERARAAARGEPLPKRARKKRVPSTVKPEKHCPYEVLGIPKTASPEEIKTAYRRRIRENHPDKVASLSDELKSLAEEMSKRINAAYEAIKSR